MRRGFYGDVVNGWCNERIARTQRTPPYPNDGDCLLFMASFFNTNNAPCIHDALCPCAFACPNSSKIDFRLTHLLVEIDGMCH